MIGSTSTIKDMISELEYKRESAMNDPEDYFATSDIDVWKKGIKELDDKIFELRVKTIENDNASNNHTQEESPLNGNLPLQLFPNKQIIKIGIRSFSNFTDFFELLRTKDKTKISQIKSGVILIYAIARYIEDKSEQPNMLVSDLIKYGDEFIRKFSNWLTNKGAKFKGSIITTDCIRANEILSKCNVSIKFILSENGQEILIKK